MTEPIESQTSLNAGSVRETLRGHWPTSRKLTPEFVAEHVSWFAALTAESYAELVDRYRRQATDLLSPPSARILRKYLTARPEARFSDLLYYVIIDHGWDDAVRRGLNYEIGGDDADKLRAWMIQCGMKPGTGMEGFYPDWLCGFVAILHSGDVIGAYGYAAENAPEELKPVYRCKAERFGAMGNENAKKYFPCFRLESMKLRPLPERIGNHSLRQCREILTSKTEGL